MTRLPRRGTAHQRAAGILPATLFSPSASRSFANTACRLEAGGPLSRLASVALICWLVVTPAFANPVTLRARIEASGPSITLGDVFEGVGAVASREIGPAPAPGQVATLPMPLLTAVASAAGLEFAPPAGVLEVRVVRPAGMRATLPASSALTSATPLAASLAVVRRGQAVSVVYQGPGVEIRQAGLRALSDGAIGQPIRLQNGDRTIDAVVTGPGAARINAP